MLLLLLTTFTTLLLRWGDPEKTRVDVFLTRNGKRVATCEDATAMLLHPAGAGTRGLVMPSLELSTGECVLLNFKGSPPSLLPFCLKGGVES